MFRSNESLIGSVAAGFAPKLLAAVLGLIRSKIGVCGIRLLAESEVSARALAAKISEVKVAKRIIGVSPKQFWTRIEEEKLFAEMLLQFGRTNFGFNAAKFNATYLRLYGVYCSP